MEIRSLVIAILIVVVTILQSGEARRCYVCDSRKSNTCASGPVVAEEAECLSNLKCGTCIYNLSNGTTITNRLCGYMDVPPAQSVETGNCNMCEGDLCNTANTTTMSMTALACLVSFWMMRFVFKHSY